jgi:tetratricopeptide (TPR) repeat protein
MSSRGGKRSRLLLAAALLVALAIGLLFFRGGARKGPSPEAVAAMARGVGMLESFQYGPACEALHEAVTLAPDWTDAKVDYAIALLNRVSDESTGESLSGKAIEVLREVVRAEPGNAHAHFLLGFLLTRTGETEEGLAELGRVEKPDAATHFWMGQAEVDRKNYEAALAQYAEALRLDHHLAAAQYGRFRCFTLLGRTEEAEAAKKAREEMVAGNGANLVTANAYHEIGRYALAIRRYPHERARRPPALVDVPATGLVGPPPGAPPGIAVGDVDGDGDLDLYVAGTLLENLGNFTFRAHGGLPPEPGLFLDYDGDRVLDLFLHGSADRLFRGRGDGTFEETTAAAGLGDAPTHARFALSADLDMDGDVDLFVTDEGGANRILRNNRNGTFTAIEVRTPGPSRGAIVADIDNDLDPDLVVAQDDGPPRLLRNERAAGFVDVGPAPQPQGPALIAADLDADGHEEVLTIDHPVLCADFDLDGALDEVDLPGATCATAADLDGDGVPEAVFVDGQGAVHVRTCREAKGHWVAFDLRGRTPATQDQWSAPVGPGATVEVLAGGTWQLRVSRSVEGFGGQQSPLVHFGLGSHVQADVVRILWPDRVLQAELDVPAGRVKTIEEANRKPSSCPLLFADGPGGTRFVTDLLGSGGLGFFLEPGVFGKPDPDEVIRIDGLEPVGPDYILRMLEPLEEISYLDEATLLAVDHPAEVEAIPNERFAGEEPFPEFRIFEIGRRIAPVRAFDDRGRDATALVAAVDRRYAPLERDTRFEGFAEPHWLALDFTGRVPALAPGERLVLLLDGWVEYGYSHSNLAALQAGLALSPPCLELEEGDGWRTAIPNAGYPAGLPRTMTLDVTGVVTAEHPVFRLRTNMEIYWDRIELGVDRGSGAVRISRVLPRSAELRERGYPREYRPDGALPLLYDYSLMDPGYPFRTMKGDYTRFGEVAPLLARPDDTFVIFGKGEEVVLRYPAAKLPDLPAGWRRTFMLYAVGYCKDMDAYTAFGETVEPLPFHAMSNYPYGEKEAYPDDDAHRLYRREWNTRRVPAR